MKKILIALVIGLGMIGLIGCTEATSTLDEYKYVTLKINPSIDFVVNEEDEVEEVIPTNEDAEVVVSELDLVSMPITEAIDAYVEAVTETGYLDPEEVDNEVIVEVVTGDEEETEEYGSTIRERINRYFQNNGIFGVAVMENLDEYLAKAEELGINVDELPLGKVKAIVVALDANPDLDVTELVEMSVGDIIKLISNRAKENDVNAALKDEFKLAQEELMAKYARLFELRTLISELETQIENHTGTEDELAVLQANLQTLQDEFDSLHEAYKAEMDILREAFKAQSELVREEQKALRESRREAAKAKVEAARELAKANRKLRQEIGKRQGDDEFDPFVTEEGGSDDFAAQAQAIREEYASFFTLKDEVVALRQELNTFTGTEEEKEALVLELEAKMDEMKDLRKDFYSEMSDLAKEVRAAVRKGQADQGKDSTTGRK
ncbi:MAG: hypothetical protein PHD85_01665 [Bacilli bacterium]|nr:hypothetical protein [Bacilli bacterium]